MCSQPNKIPVFSFVGKDYILQDKGMWTERTVPSNFDYFRQINRKCKLNEIYSMPVVLKTYPQWIVLWCLLVTAAESSNKPNQSIDCLLEDEMNYGAELCTTVPRARHPLQSVGLRPPEDEHLSSVSVGGRQSCRDLAADSLPSPGGGVEAGQEEAGGQGEGAGGQGEAAGGQPPLLHLCPAPPLWPPLRRAAL